mgnify:CR=1 FL=1
MCLVIFAHQTSAKYPLLVAANRDEFHARPTAPAQRWPEAPDLLAGRDLEQGGTWMGVTEGGRFAAVTNFRDPDRSAPAPLSRGALPLDFLQGKMGAQQYLLQVQSRAHDYAGFNLLVGDKDALWYYDNSPGEQPQQLAPGIYGLSNARLDPPWPKVNRGKQAMRQLIADGNIDHASLAQLVGDRQLADPASLHPAGSKNSNEHLLSAQFIVTQGYGTRSTTTLWRDNCDRIDWCEESYDAEGKSRGKVAEVLSPGAVRSSARE